MLAIIGVIIYTGKLARNGQGEPVGIGGWLILPILGMAVTIVLTMLTLFVAVSEFEGIYALLSDQSGEFNMLLLAISLSLVFGLAAVVTAAICLYRIFVVRRNVMNVGIVHFAILALSGVVELWGDRVISSTFTDIPPDPTAVRDMVRSFIAAAIWIPYFAISKRVKNTFESSPANSMQTTTSSLAGQ